MNLFAAMVFFILGAVLLGYGLIRFPSQDPYVLERIRNCEDEHSQKMRDDEVNNRHSRATLVGAAVSFWVFGFILLAV